MQAPDRHFIAIFQASAVSADILALFADEQFPLNDPISRNPMDLDRENNLNSELVCVTYTTNNACNLETKEN